MEAAKRVYYYCARMSNHQNRQSDLIKSKNISAKLVAFKPVGDRVQRRYKLCTTKILPDSGNWRRSHLI